MPRRILIVDTVCTNRILSSGDLGSARIATEALASVPAARVSLMRKLPDLVIVALGDGQPGLDFIAELRERRDTRALPIIAVASAPTARDRLAALGAGADDVFVRPIPTALLVARIRSLLKRVDALADLRPDGDTQRALGFAEDAEGFVGHPGRAQVTLLTGRAGSLAAPLDQLAQEFGTGSVVRSNGSEISLLGQPDLIVIDGAGGAAGLDEAIARAARGRCLSSSAVFRQVADIRSDPLSRHSAIMVVLPPGATDQAVMALDLGANDVVTTETGLGELRHRARSLVARKALEGRLRDRLRDGLQAAVTDPLTGLYNRRYAMPRLSHLTTSAWNRREAVAVLVLDIDHFKQVNDRHGHAAGDVVLAEVAHRLASELRPDDLLARIGGEEFLAVLPATGEAEAGRVAERLRRAVGDRPIRLPRRDCQRTAEPVSLSVTMSIGVSVSPVAPPELRGEGHVRPDGETLYCRADTALYAAKSAGRDRVRVEHPTAA